jgi:hypothetical protein
MRYIKVLSLIFGLAISCQKVTEPLPIPADVTPPSPVTDLAVKATTSTTATLTWLAPGDDGRIGQADEYDVRYFTEPISKDNWNSTFRATGEPLPGKAGAIENFIVKDLSNNTLYYFALRTADGVPNWSTISNVVSARTTSRQDSIPPAPVTDLAVVKTGIRSITLSWTAPGDDGNIGQAAEYDIRYADFPINMNTWEDAARLTVSPQPQAAGNREEVLIANLIPGETYWAALKTRDEELNQWSAMSNVAMGTLQAGQTTIEQLGICQTSDYAMAVKIMGNIAYVADYDSGLQIIDVTNLRQPQIKGHITIPGKALDLDVKGSYAYIAAEEGGLQIIDISNPVNPIIAGNFVTSGQALSVTLIANIAFVANADPSGIQALDLGNPVNPHQLSYYETANAVYRAVLFGKNAIILAESGGWEIVDYANIYRPLQLGIYKTPDDVRDAAVVGQYLYLADNFNGLLIFDITDRDAPYLAAAYNTPGQALSLTFYSNYVFVADGWAGGLQVIDIKYPFIPKLAGSLPIPDIAHDVYVVDGTFFIAAGRAGLLICRLTPYQESSFQMSRELI